LVHDIWIYQLLYPLWVRTGLGEKGLLHRFNIKTYQDNILGKIDGKRNYYLKDRSNNASYVLSTMFEASTGLLIQTYDQNKLIAEQTYFQNNSNQPNIELSNIYANSLNQVFLGSDDGMVYFSATQGMQTTHNRYKNKNTGRVWSIAPLSQHHLLVSTQYLGILVFDIKQEKYIHQYAADNEDYLSIANNQNHEIYIDRSDCVWVSSWGHGIDYATIGKNRFGLINLSNTDKFSETSSIVIGPDDRIWTSDRAYGITVYNQNMSIYRRLNPISSLNLSNDAEIQKIYFDKTNRLWAIIKYTRSRSSQLVFLDKESNQWKKSASTSKIVDSMIELKSGRILVSTNSGILELLDNRELIECKSYVDYNNLPFYDIRQMANGDIYMPANFDKIIVSIISKL